MSTEAALFLFLRAFSVIQCPPPPQLQLFKLMGPLTSISGTHLLVFYCSSITAKAFGHYNIAALHQLETFALCINHISSVSEHRHLKKLYDYVQFHSLNVGDEDDWMSVVTAVLLNVTFTHYIRTKEESYPESTKCPCSGPVSLQKKGKGKKKNPAASLSPSVGESAKLPSSS